MSSNTPIAVTSSPTDSTESGGLLTTVKNTVSGAVASLPSPVSTCSGLVTKGDGEQGQKSGCIIV